MKIVGQKENKVEGKKSRTKGNKNNRKKDKRTNGLKGRILKGKEDKYTGCKNKINTAGQKTECRKCKRTEKICL